MNRSDRFIALLVVALGSAGALLLLGADRAVAASSPSLSAGGPPGAAAGIAMANADNAPLTSGALPAGGGPSPQVGGTPESRNAAAANEPLQRATALAKAGKYKEAIAELEAQRKKGPAPAPSLSLLGTLYLQVGKPVEAMGVLRPLAEKSDAGAATLYQAGRAALTLRELAVAQGYFQRSLALEPASPAAREMGLILAHQGKVVEGYALLRPWAVRNPADGEALLTAAALAVELERPQEAEQMIAGMPQNDPAILLLRGKILVEKGDGAKAVPLLTPLLTKHPPGMEPEVRRTLAEADMLSGQPAQAVALLDGRIAGHPSLALLLARAQRQSGAVAAAAVTLRPYAEQLPAEGGAVPDPRVAGGVAMEYGQILAASGRQADGIGYLERATRIEPNRREAWEALAKALSAAGRKDEAQKASAKATALEQSAAKTGGR